MDFEADYHPDGFHVLPLLHVAIARCESGHAAAFSIAVGWLFWTVSLVVVRGHKH